MYERGCWPPWSGGGSRASNKEQLLFLWQRSPMQIKPCNRTNLLQNKHSHLTYPISAISRPRIAYTCAFFPSHITTWRPFTTMAPSLLRPTPSL